MAKFSDAIQIVLDNEGGYVNDPNDAGGETNFGISKRAYPNVDIKNLTVEDAKRIYFSDFWRFGEINNQALATKIFDMYVLAKHNSTKVLQRLLGAHDDGLYGPATERLVNLEDPFLLISRFRTGMVQYFLDVVQAHPEDAEFLNGWLKRSRQ